MSSQPPSLFDPDAPEPSLFESGGPRRHHDLPPTWAVPPPARPLPAEARPGQRWPQVLGFPLAVIVLGVLLGVIAVLVLVAVGAPSPFSGDRATTSAPSITFDSSLGPAPATTAPRNQTAILGDGIYLVGTDVQPGRYVTSDHRRSCHWARLGAFAGGERPVLASGTGRAHPSVTIGTKDAAFRTTGCTAWQRR